MLVVRLLHAVDPSSIALQLSLLAVLVAPHELHRRKVVEIVLIYIAEPMPVELYLLATPEATLSPERELIFVG